MPEPGDRALSAVGTKGGPTLCFYYSQSVEREKEDVKLVNIPQNLKLSHFKRLVDVSYISFMMKIMKLASK